MKSGFVISGVLVAAFAFGQATKPATPKATGSTPSKSGAAQKGGASATKAGAPGLPSRATVDAFLHQLFGWEPEVKITVKDIKWSPAPSIAEIDLHAETPTGAADRTMYVTSDHKTIIAGQMFPFGGQAGVKPTNEQIDAFVRQMTSGNPGITWSVLEVKPNALGNLTEVAVGLANPQGQRGSQTFWVTADGQHALAGDPSPFGADPFAPARNQLARGINGPGRGPAVSTIQLVEFGDLECPACKAAAPILERLVKDEPKAHFVFQQFPLTKIHHWAYKAALFGDCIARENNGAFWKFMDAVYSAQEDISSHVETTDPTKKPDLGYAEQKLTELAGQVGMDGKQVAACAANPATASRIDHSMALGNEMQVTSTPTVFINGRRITNLGNMPYDSLKRMVEFMGSAAK